MNLDEIIEGIQNTPGFENEKPFKLYVKHEGKEEYQEIVMPSVSAKGAKTKCKLPSKSTFVDCC